MVIHDLSMEMVNIIPCDLRLLDEHHHNRPAFDVVTAVVCSIMHPLATVLSVVPDANLKLLFIFVLHVVLICTTVCFQIIKEIDTFTSKRQRSKQECSLRLCHIKQ